MTCSSTPRFTLSGEPGDLRQVRWQWYGLLMEIKRVASEPASRSHVEWHVGGTVFRTRWAAKLYAATPTPSMLDDLDSDRQVLQREPFITQSWPTN